MHYLVGPLFEGSSPPARMLAREVCMTFEQFIDWLAAVSAIVTAVNIYLMINKIWSRKHIKDVAQSISVAGRTLGWIRLSRRHILFRGLCRNRCPSHKKQTPLCCRLPSGQGGSGASERTDYRGLLNSYVPLILCKRTVQSAGELSMAPIGPSS